MQSENDETNELLSGGFFFSNTQEEEHGIYTRINADGTITKRMLLPRCNRIVVMRQANNKDFLEAGRLTDDPDRQVRVLVAGCTTFDGKRPSLDDIENLSYGDFIMLIMAGQNLNWER